MKNKTKRILSMVTAVAITASAFSAFAINASADEEIAVLQGIELLSEDFATVTDAWGFSGAAGAEIVDGVLNLADKTTANKTTSVTKTMDEEISSQTALNIKFDWASRVQSGKDRSSGVELYDDNGNLLFAMYGKGGAKTDSGIKYATAKTDGAIEWQAVEGHTSGKYYTIDINVNFIAGTLSGKISDTATGGVLVTIPETKIAAKNFATIWAGNYYSAAPMSLDNVVITAADTADVTFAIVGNGDGTAVADAEIVIGEATYTTDADGMVTASLPFGTYDYAITAHGHEIFEGSITVDADTAQIPVTLTYAGESVITAIEIGGGDDGIYKPKSGANTTVNKYVATVYDQTEQIMDTEEVEWSIVAAADGASISEDGIVTVTDAFPVADINGETIVVKATSKTNPEVSATTELHVFDVARATTFEIAGPSSVKDGLTAEYTIVNVKDQYGVDYVGDATYTLSTNAADVAIEGMTVTPNTGTVQTKDFTITATASDVDYQGNSIKATKTVTAYAFDFYETQVGGSAYGDVRTGEVAGATYTVWPKSSGGTATQTITLPVPVEMTPGSAKLITYSTAWTTKTVSSQERYMTLDFSGEAAKDITIGYQGGVYVDPSKVDGNFVSDIQLGSQGAASTFEETLIIVKTDIDGNSTATISYAGGTPVVVELGSDIGALTSFVIKGGKGAPDERLLAIKDIKISDSDITEIEISGDDTIAKIAGKVATKKYEASVFVLEDGETFTWAVSGGDAAESKKRVFKLTEKADSAVIVKAEYGTNNALESIVSTPVTIAADAEYVDAPAAAENTEYFLWNSLSGMKPLSAGVEEITVDGGVTIDQDGVLSVPDTIEPGTIVTITYTSDLRPGKTASKDITIADFASIESFNINGPATVNAGDIVEYSVSDITDEYGDAVDMTPTYAITEGADIASIDAQTGVLTTDKDITGTVTVAVTLGNPGKEKTNTMEVVVGKFSAAGESDEDVVTVNVAELANYADDTMYRVTTANNAGEMVSQTEVAHNEGIVEVDMTDASRYEVSPIYSYTEVGDVKAGKEFPICDGLYDFTFVKSGGARGDIFVNDCMVGNNVDQTGKQRTTGGTEYSVKDVMVKGGKVVVRMTDDSSLSSITIKKAPSILPRKTHVYIAGDSTAASYNGRFSSDVEIIGGLPKAGQAQTGWGQVFEQFVSEDMNVTNIAESGSYAEAWYSGCFKGGVINQAQPGDYFIVSFGINDRNYSSADKMEEALTKMIEECREAGIIPVLVSSQRWSNTYGENAAGGWEGYFDRVINVAQANGALNVNLTDLTYDYFETIGKESVTQNYNIYYGGASQDNLHLSYFGAMKCAEIIAQNIVDQQSDNVTTANGESFGEFHINKDASYTFTKVDGTTETLQVK